MSKSSNNRASYSIVFSSILKHTYSSYILKQISDCQFKEKMEQIIIKASNVDYIQDENLKFLKLLSKNYIKLLLNQNEIELRELKNVCSISHETWFFSEDYENVRQVILKFRAQILNSDYRDFQCREKYSAEFYRLFESRNQNISLDIEELKTLISHKFLRAASLYYERLKFDLTMVDINKLNNELFIKALNTKDISYLEDVVKKFNINLKTFKFIGSSGTIFANHLVAFFDEELLQDTYLSFLVRMGACHDDDIDRVDFKEVDYMTSLLQSCKEGNFQITKLLLKHGADINKVVEIKSDHLCSIFRTPYSVSSACGNIEFVKFLVSQGADPTLAIKHTINNINNITGINLLEYNNFHLIPTMNLALMQGMDKEIFIKQYLSIIEDYYVDKIIESSELLSEKLELSAFTDSTITDKTIFSTTSHQETNSLLNEYINFKAAAQNDDKGCKPPDNPQDFNMLLLNYCHDSSESNLQQLHDYLEENPQFHHHALNSIIANDESVTLAHDIFMENPKLLHKFFTMKKQLNYNSKKVSEDEKIPQGVYCVESKGLTNKIFLSLTSNLFEKLKENELFNKKVQAALQDCKFIKTVSKGLTGIKTYNGICKLKIKGEDISLITNNKYLENSTGNTLIVFDQLNDHKKKISTKLNIIHVDSLISVCDQLINHDSCESENNTNINGCLDEVQILGL